MTGAAIMALGVLIDAGLGWPNAVFVRIGHPVTWIGALIATLDDLFNREQASKFVRRAAGVVTAIGVIALAAGTGWLIAAALPTGWVGVVLAGILAWPLIAVRSLHDHVAAVASPLVAGDIDRARLAVAMIVGRDPAALDEAGIARAAIESLAENTSDGIVAPVFWGVVFGLPGIAAYKAINTLDSMIGHRTPRHEAFGWAAARIDDAVNLVPARLTGVLFAIVSERPGAAITTMWRDAHYHRSPNAGWPEAAMAGAIKVRLSGPRLYHGVMSAEPWVNAAALNPGVRDLQLALALYRRAMVLLTAALGTLAIL